MALHLEDNFEDILSKAQAGLGLSVNELAERSGFPAQTIRALRKGELVEDALLAVAPELDLEPHRLLTIARGEWIPEPVELPGLATFTTSFSLSADEDMLVNAYLARHPQSTEAAVFDTGADGKPIIKYVKTHALKVSAIFITHSHRDHVADLNALHKSFADATTYAATSAFSNSTRNVGEGDVMNVGKLKISVLATPGHAGDGLSYLIEGLEKPVAIVGDALFAGSAGGAQNSWKTALTAVREKILSLPEETVICPGHGPLTTVAEERANNPLFGDLG